MKVAKWLEGLEALVGGGPGGPKRVRTFRWLLVIGGIGAALMLLSSFLNVKQVEPVADQPPSASGDEAAWAARNDVETPFEAIERPLENRIKEILEKIVGVGTVDVLVTIDSTEEVVYEKNENFSQQVTDENDKNGGRRHITSVTRDGQVVIYEESGDQQPVVTKKIKPKIRGILIVARGAEDATVRRLILDAVQKGIRVPVNSISVVPRKQQ
ncbi:stage III sporulation protein AG [Paenibacillus cisolokensis]|uniref:Stage III sporulation protein AG n=1 Tax=Paenibacillus cisolokensis TaxID=1658519 RepID=A0ABQ4NDF7_9BACL|nr:stage III sporulation protein AG [Paenibacillus cisolokensis]